MPVIILPALAAVVIGLLLLLLVYAVEGLARLLSGIFPDIGIPGIGNIRSIVSGAVHSVIDGVAVSLQAVKDVVDGFILAPVIAAANWFQEIQLSIRDVVAALERLYGGIIVPGLMAVERYATGILHSLTAVISQSLAVALDYAKAVGISAIQTAESLVNNATAYVEHVISNVYNTLVGYIGDVERYILAGVDAIYRQLAGDLVALEQTVSSDVSALAAQSVALFDQSITTAEHLASEAVTVAETYASAAVASAIQAVDVDVTTILSKAWAEIDDTVTGLEGVIATDLPDIGALVRAIPSEAAGVVGALAGVTAISATALKFMEECGIPNCKNLGGYGWALKDLLGLVGSAALLAFIIEAIDSPDTAARDTVNVAGGIVDGTVRTVRTMVGV